MVLLVLKYFLKALNNHILFLDELVLFQKLLTARLKQLCKLHQLLIEMRLYRLLHDQTVQQQVSHLDFHDIHIKLQLKWRGQYCALQAQLR